jgi:hypothetical protein
VKSIEGGAGVVGHDADMVAPVELEVKVNPKVLDCVSCFNTILKGLGGVSKPDVGGLAEASM